MKIQIPTKYIAQMFTAGLFAIAERLETTKMVVSLSRDLSVLSEASCESINLPLQFPTYM